MELLGRSVTDGTQKIAYKYYIAKRRKLLQLTAEEKSPRRSISIAYAGYFAYQKRSEIRV